MRRATLRTTKPELIVRIHNAGFAHLLKPEVLEQALRQHSRRSTPAFPSGAGSG
jgi:hypothetical protein